MNQVPDFETYLIISYDKFEIQLLDTKNFINLYKDELIYETFRDNIDLNLLIEFLEKNIFKLEKVLGRFVNNINLIIENKSVLKIDLGVKRKNYSGNITNVFLENVLKDIKDLFKESYREYKLLHMLINKYTVNGESFFSLQNEINSDEIFLEIKLISIPNLITLEVENILKKYQIQVNNYLDKEYVKGFFLDKQLDVSQMAYKLKNGMNKNEIQITSKSPKKLGFFEKFFQLFS